MKDENPLVAFVGGIMIGAGLLALVMSAWPKGFAIYSDAVLDTHKEAYENGHMVKEITKDDKVIYRWKHLEKIGYEENQ
jgi:hypothetical protein